MKPILPNERAEGAERVSTCPTTACRLPNNRPTVGGPHSDTWGGGIVPVETQGGPCPEHACSGRGEGRGLALNRNQMSPHHLTRAVLRPRWPVLQSGPIRGGAQQKTRSQSGAHPTYLWGSGNQSAHVALGA